MDRARRRSGFLVAAGLAALAAGPAAPILHAQRWLAPGADAARILTRRPVECLAVPRDADAAWSVEVGRAAFRTPLLLGGQAARAGVECETCHRNGRTNPDFDLPGLSGAPGTADVTSFLFSTHRGDHVDDPRPIPDLGGPKSALKVSQATRSLALEHFIRGLVTEEFEGAEPPPAVLTGLAAYVRAMDPAACPAGDVEAVRVGGAVEDSRRAVRAAIGALDRKDAAAAILMIQAARSRLGDIAERYVSPDLARDLAGVKGADLDLAAAVADVRAGAPTAGEGLAAWLAESERWAEPLRADEGRSLYDEAVLRRALLSLPPLGEVPAKRGMGAPA